MLSPSTLLLTPDYLSMSQLLTVFLFKSPKYRQSLTKTICVWSPWRPFAGGKLWLNCLPPPPPVFPSSFQTRKGRIYVLMVKYSEGGEKIPREKTERRRSFEHLAAGAATFARLEKVTSDIVSFRVWLAQVTPLEWLFVLEKLSHVLKKISLLKDTDL